MDIYIFPPCFFTSSQRASLDTFLNDNDDLFKLLHSSLFYTEHFKAICGFNKSISWLANANFAVFVPQP